MRLHFLEEVDDVYDNNSEYEEGTVIVTRLQETKRDQADCLQGSKGWGVYLDCPVSGGPKALSQER